MDEALGRGWPVINYGTRRMILVLIWDPKDRGDRQSNVDALAIGWSGDVVVASNRWPYLAMKVERVDVYLIHMMAG